ncbi:MAG: sigma-70 family RNA polymerase sigma factor [Candidatus Omnitrophica bacterium]|nr:sigma-70 family RNA polymerase sigma factor [Candidatus Omnitrophota bacterium]
MITLFLVAALLGGAAPSTYDAAPWTSVLRAGLEGQEDQIGLQLGADPRRITDPTEMKRKPADALSSAQQRLVEDYLYLVEIHVNKLVKEIGGRAAADSIRSAGYLGLIKAAQNFNPDLGNQFGTYAGPVIEGSMRHEWRDQIAPNDRRGRPRPTAFSQLSAGEDGDSVLERSSAHDPLENAPQRLALEGAIARLPKEDQDLWQRFSDGYSQEQMAADLKVSQMEISRWLNRIRYWLIHEPDVWEKRRTTSRRNKSLLEALGRERTVFQVLGAAPAISFTVKTLPSDIPREKIFGMSLTRQLKILEIFGLIQAKSGRFSITEEGRAWFGELQDYLSAVSSDPAAGLEEWRVISGDDILNDTALAEVPKTIRRDASAAALIRGAIPIYRSPECAAEFDGGVKDLPPPWTDLEFTLKDIDDLASDSPSFGIVVYNSAIETMPSIGENRRVLLLDVGKAAQQREFMGAVAAFLTNHAIENLDRVYIRRLSSGRTAIFV